MSLLIGAIADDDTGATDLAGMLTSQGLRAIIVLETASAEQLQEWSRSVDAVIIGTASRSVAKQDAYDRTFRAAELLLGLKPRLLAVKYCSTFDSTPEGNIGAALDAAMDASGESFTVALPALPALGRTTYMGYHFVGDQLLSDSTLRNHPLHPMTNPHLPSHLQSQTRRRVGLVTYKEGPTASAIQDRLTQMRTEGCAIAVLDCVDHAHLRRNAEAIAGMRLISGSSAWATALPQVWRDQATLNLPAANLVPERCGEGNGFLIVSGSCSAATRVQNEWMSSQEGCVTIALDAVKLLDPASDHDDVIGQAVQTLISAGTCLLTTTGVYGKAELHAAAGSLGLDPIAAGERISASLAKTVGEIFNHAMPQGLIVAGGETSSVLMRSLRLGALRVGPNIEPGVPVCVALSKPNLGVALKSGNFGSQDFYARARTAILQLPHGGSRL
ncbi:MAG TPA: four-carbon acid sugar kinase family protein [Acidobacteriaceae bacterium]|nr:four-carbon acid sugar kinase family protein [Acidobacteriaceae bacterium]